MPEETPLQTGDIVHLNSGSPDLKVIGIVNGGRDIAVEWQDSMGNRARSQFPRACVRRLGECQAGSIMDSRNSS